MIAMTYTPTKLQRDALRRIESAPTWQTKVVDGKIPALRIGRRVLNALFKKSLVRWGGPVYFGCVFASRRGRRFL